MIRDLLGRVWPERGSIALIVTLALPAVLGLAALGTDAGFYLVEQQRVAAAVDASVLSGVLHLPSDPELAIATALNYLERNGVVSSTAEATVTEENRLLTLQAGKLVPLYFARIFMPDGVNVQRTAAARQANVSGVFGATPLGVPDQAFMTGQTVTLKLSANAEEAGPGNYLALALGKNGASAYEANMKYGYQEWLRADDWVATEPGNMVGPAIRASEYRINQDPYATWETVEKGSARLLLVPILAGYDVNGRGEVQVIGFAVMFLEGVLDKGSDKGEIYGRFLTMQVQGEAAAGTPDFGAHKSKLVW
jgi:hypothetical protein